MFNKCQHPWWPVSEVKCAHFLREPLEQYYLPFKEASAVCHSLGEGHAHLLTINSPAEQAKVESHLFAQNPRFINSPYMVDYDFWVQVGGGDGPDDDPASFANYISEEEAKKEGKTVDISGNNTCAVVLAESGKWIRENCNEKHKIVCQKVLFGKAARLKKLKEERLERRLKAIELTIQQVLKGQTHHHQADKQPEAEPVTVPGTVKNQSFEALSEAKIADTNEERMQAVKEMARAVWRASKEDRTNGNEWLKARLVLGALSTLQVMGLQEEVAEGRYWLEREFNFEALNDSLPMAEITSEVLGGLLSLFALTSVDEPALGFVERALKVATAIRPAFNTISRMPLNAFNPAAQLGLDHFVTLSTVGGGLLERIYLSDLTGEWFLLSEATQAELRLRTFKQDEGANFFPNVVVVGDSTESDVWSGGRTGLGAAAADFYRSLLGAFILNSDALISEKLEAYAESMEGFINAQVIRGNDTTGLGVVLELNLFPWRQFSTEKLMDYEVCYVGGLLALGAREIEKMAARLNISSSSSHFETFVLSPKVAARHRKLAEQIAETCYQASTRTATRLGPAHFSPDGDFKSSITSSNYDLSPELAETHFLLWRLTGDAKYRERAWEMVQAIREYARTPNGGYSSVSNVYDLSTKGGKNEYTGTMPHFLSATLKYLYLTFADPKEVLPLDKWVFNAVGHPFPICGQHSEDIYAQVRCRRRSLSHTKNL
ncbi:hypothetical protein TYRP_003576 [Tyrophagus putrescentiae]|nr:hypothetical protein TYRP_003576 [Tyrophagus putrescentiae]